MKRCFEMVIATVAFTVWALTFLFMTVVMTFYLKVLQRLS